MKPFAFNRPPVNDATSLLASYKKGETTPLDVVEEKLRNIAQHHPKINAMTQLFAEEALLKAKEITEKKDYQGKLSGIPISLKEPIGIAGEEITASSIRMPPRKSEADAELVKKLKAEGAIIIARTNTPEFSFSHETKSPRYGRTNNPFLLSRIPGGSSGGESALIASGGSILGIGTDVGGSIRYPAHCCGLVGFKPAGLSVNKEGIFPPIQKEWILDQWLAAGPIAQTVRDAELVYDIIAQKPISKNISLKESELIIAQDFDYEVRSRAIKAAMQKAKSVLSERVLKSRDVSFPNVSQIHWSFGKLMIKGLKMGLENWLRNEKDVGISVFVESLRRLIGEKTISGGIYTLLLASKVLEPSDTEAEKIDQFLRQELVRYQELIGENGLLLLPTSGDIALRHGEAVRMDMSPITPKIFTPLTFTNVTNLAAITIPAWKYRDSNTGLPASVMLCTVPESEKLLFEAAYLLEKELN